MDDIQRDKTNMFRRTNYFLGDQAADFAAFTQVAVKKALLAANIAAIDAADTVATADNTGYAIQKNTLRTTMSGQFMKISRGITAHFFDLSDHVNRKLFDFTESEMTRFPDSDFKRKSASLSTKGTALGVALVPFGVTALNLSAFAANVTLFESYMPQSLEKRDETKAYGDEVDRLIDIGDEICAGLDIHCALVADTNPVVHGEYLNARTTVSSGGGDGTRTFQLPLAASETKVVCNIIYGASTPMVLSNIGSATTIRFYFKLLGVVVGTPVIVNAGASQSVVMSDLNVDADELWVKNEDVATATVSKAVIN